MKLQKSLEKCMFRGHIQQLMSATLSFIQKFHCVNQALGCDLKYNIVINSLKIFFFTLTERVDPYEMPHYAAFYPGIHCL